MEQLIGVWLLVMGGWPIVTVVLRLNHYGLATSLYLVSEWIWVMARTLEYRRGEWRERRAMMLMSRGEIGYREKVAARARQLREEEQGRQQLMEGEFNV